MARSLVTILAALSLLATTAFGGIQLVVGNGNTTAGTLEPANEVERYFIDCPAGAVIKVKAKGAKDGPAVSIRILDDQEAVLGADRIKEKGQAASASKVVAPTTARYEVQVTSRDQTTTGDYTIKIGWKSPKKYVGPDAVGVGETFVEFAADAESLITAKVTAKKSDVVPNLLRIDGPNGFSLDLTAPALKAASDTAKKIQVPFSGTYALVVEDTNATGGGVKASVKVKQPKSSKSRVDVTDDTIGTGQAGGQAAVAKIIGAAGGELVIVPPADPNDPLSAIVGAGIDIPPGALPSNTPIVIGTAEELVDSVTGQNLAGIGPAVFFGPEGLEFLEAVDLTIPVDFGLVADPGDVVLITKDADGNLSVVPGPYVVNVPAGTITAAVSHFSVFAGVGPPFVFTPFFETIATVSLPEVLLPFGPGEFGTSFGGAFVANRLGDSLVHKIEFLELGGTSVSTFAGGGVATRDGTDRLDFDFGTSPLTSLAATPGGQLLVATPVELFIIETNGAVNRFAGTGGFGSSGDGGPALSATFGGIAEILVDPVGNVFIADVFFGRIRQIDLLGDISPFLGITAGNSADGTPLSVAGFDFLVDMVPANGGFYIADSARVRFLSGPGPSEVNLTVAGDPLGGASGVADGLAPTVAQFAAITAIDYDFVRNILYVADLEAGVVYQVDFEAGLVSILAGQVGVPGLGIEEGPLPGLLGSPADIAIAGDGLIIADSFNNLTRFAHQFPSGPEILMAKPPR